jgi:hypothetical protein
MGHQRSYLAGMTDYTGVKLEDIQADFNGWLTNTTKTIQSLQNYRKEAKSSSALLENPTEIISFIEYFIDLFSRYENDIKRLNSEIKKEVTPSHIEIISQLYKSSKIEEQSTINFKNDWVYKALPHEEMRTLLDNIYGDVRDMLIDYKDLSNLIPRLKTFIRSSPASTEAFPDLHLKPNFFGIGLNLNRILGRLLAYFRKS